MPRVLETAFERGSNRLFKRSSSLRTVYSVIRFTGPIFFIPILAKYSKYLNPVIKLSLSSLSSNSKPKTGVSIFQFFLKRPFLRFHSLLTRLLFALELKISCFNMIFPRIGIFFSPPISVLSEFHLFSTSSLPNLPYSSSEFLPLIFTPPSKMVSVPSSPTGLFHFLSNSISSILSTLLNSSSILRKYVSKMTPPLSGVVVSKTPFRSIALPPLSLSFRDENVFLSLLLNPISVWTVIFSEGLISRLKLAIDWEVGVRNLLFAI